MARDRNENTTMGAALGAAGVRADALTCRIHAGEPRPCRRCDRIFTMAEKQRTARQIAIQKTAHAAWLAGRDR